jgi:hypothetical protein
VSSGYTRVSSADRTLGAEAWRREFERVQGDSVAELRRRTRVVLMQRALLVADVCGLLVAFACSASGPVRRI